MQGLKRFWCSVAVGAILGVLGSVNHAHADRRPRFELLTSSPVLANGVLTFSYYEGVTVRILTEDGTEILGGFIEPGVWRPDEPFVLGRYTADVSYEPNPDLAYDDTFEVIAAQAPNYGFIDIEVTSTVEAGDVVEEICCAAGAAKDPSGMPCTAGCSPLCLPLAYAAVQMVEVSVAADSDDVQADQTEITKPSETATGQYVSGQSPVEGAPDELCGVAEVFSWLDESTQLVTKCIENPKPALTTIEAAVSSFGDITECTVPPMGYEEQWCFAQAYACEVQILTLAADVQHSMVQACEHYYELCDKPSPVSASTEGTTDSVTSNGEGPEPSEGGNRAIDGSDSARGCACGVGYGGTRRAGDSGGRDFGIWALGLLGAVRMSRRIRTRAKPH